MERQSTRRSFIPYPIRNRKRISHSLRTGHISFPHRALKVILSGSVRIGEDRTFVHSGQSKTFQRTVMKRKTQAKATKPSKSKEDSDTSSRKHRKTEPSESNENSDTSFRKRRKTKQSESKEDPDTSSRKHRKTEQSESNENSDTSFRKRRKTKQSKSKEDSNTSSRKRPKTEKSKVARQKISQHPKTCYENKFACSLCGMVPFETALDAMNHEHACNGNSNPLGPWMCVICRKTDFQRNQAFQSHRGCCLPRNSTMTGDCLSLCPERWNSTRETLSDFNILVTNSIELIQASQSDIESLPCRHRKRNPLVGAIGIRCIYCVGKACSSTGSISFPDDLGTLPHNIYMMTKRHMLNSCQNIPKAMKEQMNATRPFSTQQSGSKGRIGLPAYLKILINDFGLTDNGKKEGIYWPKNKTRDGPNSGSLPTLDKDDVQSVRNETTMKHLLGEPAEVIAAADEDPISFSV